MMKASWRTWPGRMWSICFHKKWKVKGEKWKWYLHFFTFLFSPFTINKAPRLAELCFEYGDGLVKNSETAWFAGISRAVLNRWFTFQHNTNQVPEEVENLQVMTVTVLVDLNRVCTVVHGFSIHRSIGLGDLSQKNEYVPNLLRGNGFPVLCRLWFLNLAGSL